MIMKFILKKTTLFICLIGCCFASCKKLIEVGAPVTSINSENVYSNDATAAAVLTGIYSRLSSNSIQAPESLTCMSFYPGLSSDELTLFKGIGDENLNLCFTNNLNSKQGFNIWRATYPMIYAINSAITGLENSSTLTPSIKSQLLGEAKFMRALIYFYLTNLYGDVALALTTDYSINERLARSSQTEVYKQIVVDLKQAQILLNSNYLKGDILTPAEERLRPTKWAADALLARVYLYTKDYGNAEQEATKLLSNTGMFDTVSVDKVFLKNNKEAIWQLQPVNSGWNTQDARTFILPETGPSDAWPVFLSDFLMDRFEPGDKRRMNWTAKVTVAGIPYNYPAKYKIAVQGSAVGEYSTVLRLAEQYLIRAEARAQQNNTTGAINDLNVIRKRAGLPLYVGADDLGTLLTAILQERQLELFAEWGHRWFDLKRTDTVDAVMIDVAPKKGGIWNPNWKLYPLPLTDLVLDNNLAQNSGY
jgi:hypothetical protein